MRISRYDFNDLHDFRPRAESFMLDAVVEEMRKEEVVAPVKPTYSEEQLTVIKETARKEGYAEGFEAGTAQAKSESTAREQELLQLMGQLEQQLKGQQTSYDHIIAEESRSLSKFILIAARKIAGDALAHQPEVAVQELLMQCLPILISKPRIVIEVNPQMSKLLSERLKPFLERAGFEGEAQIRPNEALGNADVVVEWAGGRAVRDNESMWRGIEEMVNQLSFAPKTSA